MTNMIKENKKGYSSIELVILSIFSAIGVLLLVLIMSNSITTVIPLA